MQYFINFFIANADDQYPAGVVISTSHVYVATQEDYSSTSNSPGFFKLLKEDTVIVAAKQLQVGQKQDFYLMKTYDESLVEDPSNAGVFMLQFQIKFASNSNIRVLWMRIHDDGTDITITHSGIMGAVGTAV